jgi:hypothetical protein
MTYVTASIILRAMFSMETDEAIIRMKNAVETMVALPATARLASSTVVDPDPHQLRLCERREMVIPTSIQSLRSAEHCRNLNGRTTCSLV